jgi:dolichyldiphosphatase
VTISRVRLGYHTLEQVVAGLTVGLVSGLTWFLLVDKTSSWLFPAIAKSAIGRLFYVRDISHIPDLIVFQHELCQPQRPKTQ